MNPLALLAPSATDLIRTDHTKVVAAFHRYDIDGRPAAKQAIVAAVCLAIEIHAQLEEEIFYPAMRSADPALVEKSVPEHDEMRTLMATLRALAPTDETYDRTFMELMRTVLHHVADEETRLLPDAERLLGEELYDLGGRMTKRRLQLMAPRAGEVARTTVRALPATPMLLAVGALAAGAFLLRRNSGSGS